MVHFKQPKFSDVRNLPGEIYCLAIHWFKEYVSLCVCINVYMYICPQISMSWYFSLQLLPWRSSLLRLSATTRSGQTSRSVRSSRLTYKRVVTFTWPCRRILEPGGVIPTRCTSAPHRIRSPSSGRDSAGTMWPHWPQIFLAVGKWNPFG